MLKHLLAEGMRSIPRITCYGETTTHQFMATNSLGPNLNDLVDFCSGTISMRSAI